MLFPHEVLAYCFNEAGYTCSVEERRAYWESAKEAGELWAVSHTGSHTLHPVGLYGDSARLPTNYRQEKITGIFLNLVLFRPRSVRSSRFLLWCGDTKQIFRNRTLNQVFRYIVWSLQFAYIGIHPTHTMGGQPLQTPLAGKPLTDGSDCFAVTENRGDWEWHKFTFRFNASWVSNDICFRCPATANGPVGMRYYTFDEQSCDWLRQEFCTAQFCARRLPDKNICDLMQ